MANENFSLIRSYALGVRVPGGGSYTTVSGVIVSWTQDTGTAAVALPENAGVEYDYPTTMKLQVMFEGLQLFTASGLSARDAGQQMLYDAYTGLGNTALVEFQITHRDPALPSGSHNLTGAGYVVIEGAEGGNGDLAPFKGTINMNDRGVATGNHFTKQLGSLT